MLGISIRTGELWLHPDQREPFLWQCSNCHCGWAIRLLAGEIQSAKRRLTVRNDQAPHYLSPVMWPVVATY
jgi:hypothetical protein